MSSIQLFFKMTLINIKSEVQYRGSFILSLISTFLVTFIDVIGLVFLFNRFGLVQGWSLAEISLLYGILNISFATVEMFGRGFDMFGHYVQQGMLDILLIRPRSIFLMISGVEFKLTNIGRILQGFLPFIYGVYSLNITALWQWGMIVLSFICVSTVFFSLLIIQATFSILGQTALEFMNIFTYGSLQMGQYPLDIYNQWIKRFFTYIVPTGLVTYYPILILLGKRHKSAWLFSVISPLICGITLVLSLLYFNYGLKKYQSTGS